MRRYLSSPSLLVREAPVPVLGLALLAVTITFLVTSAQSSISWRGDFETGNLSQWNLGLQAKDPSRATVQTSVVRQGRYATRIEVRPGDNNVAGSGSGERTDLLISRATTQGYEGNEAYWAWSVFFPSDFQAPGGAWNVFTGFHHTGTTGQSNIHFDVRDMSTIGLRVMGGDFNAPVRRDFSLAPLQKGRWYDFVFHVKWSPNPGVGFVEAWVNGQHVVPKTMTPTLYFGQGTYLKQGYYRSAYSAPSVIYLDGTRKGDSYDEVAAEFGSVTPAATPPPFTVSQSIASGSSLQGTTTWTATPAGRTASLVRFKVDGVVVGTDTTAPFAMTLDTSRFENGQRAFRVEATATDGATASNAVAANVSNVTQVPSTTFTVSQSLRDGQSVSGTIPWTATATGKTVSNVVFSVNGQSVATENLAPYEAAVDTKRFGNGTFPFTVTATATDGTKTSSTARVTVANQSANTFWVTHNLWDGVTLTGTHKWVATPNGRAVRRVVFSIDGKRHSTEQHAPYEASIDTRGLSDGPHQFEAEAIFVDGRSATAASNVVIANTATPPPPPPSATLGVTQSVSTGQTLSGDVKWTASPSGKTAVRIEFSIDGQKRSTENIPPYVYGGDHATLDTRSLSNGTHTLVAKAFASDGTTATATATVKVSNGEAPSSPAAPSTPPPPAPTSPPPPVEPVTSSIKNGQTLSGLLPWTVTVTGITVDRIDYFIDGKVLWTERLLPYNYGGDGEQLDTRLLTRGAHVLVVKVVATDGKVTFVNIQVTVG